MSLFSFELWLSRLLFSSLICVLFLLQLSGSLVVPVMIWRNTWGGVPEPPPGQSDVSIDALDAKASVHHTHGSSHEFSHESSCAPSRELDARLCGPLWRRLLPIIPISVATAVSIGRLITSNHRSSDQIYRWVKEDRPTVQFVVHLLSSALAACWIYAICSTINKLVRLRLCRKEMRGERLRLWAAVGDQRIDFHLRFPLLLVTLVFAVVTAVPAAVWTGALTPRLGTLRAAAQVVVPRTGNDAYSFLSSKKDPCSTANQTAGAFGSCLAGLDLGSILASARTAATAEGSARTHWKLDNSGYRYLGRSYGVGTSVGLNNTDLERGTPLLSYTFLENGYLTEASCIYNSSSDWAIQRVQDNGPDLPSIFEATGRLPNSNWSSGAPIPSSSKHISSSDGATIVSLGSDPSPTTDDSYVFAIAAGSAYAPLDQIQCQLSLHPTTFVVAVNVTDKSIAVQPRGPTPDIEPRGVLRARATSALARVADLSPTFPTSLLGDALLTSVRAPPPHGRLFALDADPSAADLIVLRAVTGATLAVADTVLLAAAGSALAQPDASAGATTPAAAAYEAVQIGTWPYLVVTLVLNALALLFVLVAAVVHGGWAALPRVDVFDLVSLAWASALGRPPRSVGPHEESAPEGPAKVEMRIVRGEDGVFRVVMDWGDG